MYQFYHVCFLTILKTTLAKTEEYEEVFTKTIIKPVSYSFISANIQPSSEAKSVSAFLKRKTVLPGNTFDFEEDVHQPIINSYQGIATSEQPLIFTRRDRPTKTLKDKDTNGLNRLSKARLPEESTTRSNNYYRKLEPNNGYLKENENFPEEDYGDATVEPERFQNAPRKVLKNQDVQESGHYPQYELQDQQRSATANKHGNEKIAKGGENSDHHFNEKGEKISKGYQKKNNHEKKAKGYHDIENDSGEYLDEKKSENNFKKGEDYYGEQHKAEKAAKDKKYGEGKHHKKGRTTHGEHNIVKKDEYIKSTKFYDEDHDDGDAQEQGEYHGEHEEKKGGKKEGNHYQEGHKKQEQAKRGKHDKGHEEEEHIGFEHEEGSDDSYGLEEEYGGQKKSFSSKKWQSH